MQIRELSFLTVREKEILVRNRIKTLEELLYFFPFRYEGEAHPKFIQDVIPGENVSVSGIVVDIETKTGYKSGTKFTKATIKDGTGEIEAIWWNMPYLAKSIQPDQKIILTGAVSEKNGDLILNNPKIEKVKSLSLSNDSGLWQKEKDGYEIGIYPSWRKEKNFYIKKIIERAVRSPEFKSLESLIPNLITKKLGLGSRQGAILRKHFPKTDKDKEVANKYFAFEEIFVMQIYRQQEKKLRGEAHAYKIHTDKKFEKDLKEIIPFKLTNGQKKVLETILTDLDKNKPMSRLVEGDVGSGKTILALAATLATLSTEVKNGKHLQTAYIAPTEILANQHFEFFIKTLSTYTHLSIALLTSSGAKIWPSKLNKDGWTTAPKSRVKKLLDDGRLNIVIGTHSLFNKNILFEYLGLVIIDEQHRFGVKQRLAMIEKHKESFQKRKNNIKNDLREEIQEQVRLLPIPHLLSMSATPIPRTLALTIYGDLDLSILDELPPGRVRAETKIVSPTERNQMYKTIEEKLSKGKQVYIISPRISIDEENENLKSSVEFEEVRIKEKFPKYKVGILHGKQSKTDKERVIAKFYSKEIDILISTTVVEVGISVPNATAIVIENADTFGLAQLHQLRGRVERSTDHSICFLVTESENEKSLKRLGALVKSNNGFDLADVDLAERGAGSLIGNRQSGLSDIGMEAIKNRRLVEVAKEEAISLLESDPNLKDKNHKKLAQKIEEFSFHEE